MKEGMCLGLAIGLIAGALIYKHSEDAKKVLDKGEKMAREEIEKMKDQAISKK